MPDIVPVTLQGRWVRLEPLRREHTAGLISLKPDEEVWRYLSTSLATPDLVTAFVEQALAEADRGRAVPFATIDLAGGRVAGTTRLLDLRPEDRTVEIGYTWLGRSYWRSAINSESKYLLLRHLFEELRMIRVSLKTDALNQRSQRAIERLGAVREGVLRKHMIVQDGRSRDTVYFSILDDEWPAVRTRMRRELYGSDGVP